MDTTPVNPILTPEELEARVLRIREQFRVMMERARKMRELIESNPVPACGDEKRPLIPAPQE